MVLKLLLALIILITIMWYLAWYRKSPPQKRKKSLIALLLYGIAAAVIILAVTGKISWLFALGGALLPWLNRLLMMKNAWHGLNKNKQAPPPSPGVKDMNIEEAYKIFDLNHHATRQDILDAHKKLMQKNHPDRGGSNYLAQKINLAKDVLLKHLEK